MKTFLGCDWGTSSFRLRLVERGTRRILAEQAEPTGVRHFATLTPPERAARLAAHLADRIARWPEVRPEVPFVVTGMAGSSVGWQELPYAEAPFPLDGGAAVVSPRTLPGHGGRQRPGLLVSGVRTTDDILRGEETALIGWHALSGATKPGSDPAWCLLAGTHPKHARVREGRLESFRTFLTGELFEVLRKDSLLAASVAAPADDTLPDWEEFDAGVACSQALGLSGALFQVRARQVLQHVPPAANHWFLSGILVGDEVRTLAALPGRAQLHLIGEPARVALHRRALGSVDPGRGKDTLHDVSLTAAIVAGQEQLLTRHAGGLTR